MNNMRQVMAQAQKLQAKVAEVQKELENRDVTGSAGSGSVEVVMSLKGLVKSVTINKDIINAEEKDLLEDLIVAALNDAKVRADAIYEEEMRAATGGFGLPGTM
ncbi:MAG: YbaB/EbfC family nucleoid-associated protein [Holosporales bacterium]|jgi:DNA-binding YbaB/EbfC family protein|nr:YbaB/EbfC family nucleoid-associated protein [Holosporales bacterium]